MAAEAREHVDDRLMASYDKIGKSYRNGLAVVPVERDACGGCFYAIPPQKQSEIKQHKKVMVCENCGRILVDESLLDCRFVRRVRLNNFAQALMNGEEPRRDR